jgi:hypothetical protein
MPAAQDHILNAGLESARTQYATAHPGTQPTDAQLIALIAATFLLSLNGTP